MTKFDLVIEAVRYNGGKIDLVRAYERRGAAFSDHIVLGRADLLARFQAGRRIVTGRRCEYMAGSFSATRIVRVVGQPGQVVLTTTGKSVRDMLEGVPSF